MDAALDQPGTVRDELVFPASIYWLFLLAVNLVGPLLLVGLIGISALEALPLLALMMLFFAPITLFAYFARRETVVGDEGLSIRRPGGRQTAFYPWSAIVDVRYVLRRRGSRYILISLAGGGQAVIANHVVADTERLANIINQRQCGLWS